jgi:hypothetical protein
MSHSAHSHSPCSDVPGSKLATSQVAGTRWSSYGITVTCTAPPTLRRSAQFSQHQGLELRPCLRRLGHHQALAKPKPQAHPCELARNSKDTPPAARQAAARLLVR